MHRSFASQSRVLSLIFVNPQPLRCIFRDLFQCVNKVFNRQTISNGLVTLVQDTHFVSGYHVEYNQHASRHSKFE